MGRQTKRLYHSLVFNEMKNPGKAQHELAVLIHFMELKKTNLDNYSLPLLILHLLGLNLPLDVTRIPRSQDGNMVGKKTTTIFCPCI